MARVYLSERGPKEAALHTAVGKPFVVRDEKGATVAEYWNRHAAKMRMHELGGMHHVFSRIEGIIIFSPLDA